MAGDGHGDKRLELEQRELLQADRARPRSAGPVAARLAGAVGQVRRDGWAGSQHE
jgi:hypothetical protein